jgi:hypothetical protein
MPPLLYCYIDTDLFWEYLIPTALHTCPEGMNHTFTLSIPLVGTKLADPRTLILQEPPQVLSLPLAAHPALVSEGF